MADLGPRGHGTEHGEPAFERSDQLVGRAGGFGGARDFGCVGGFGGLRDFGRAGTSVGCGIVRLLAVVVAEVRETVPAPLTRPVARMDTRPAKILN
ncbi:hypothetical protein O1L60_35440 [Streptomyces diastatochromogenes]|nr:hypothetical protein [Streptomyces diastatochromogenes]